MTSIPAKFLSSAAAGALLWLATTWQVYDHSAYSIVHVFILLAQLVYVPVALAMIEQRWPTGAPKMVRLVWVGHIAAALFAVASYWTSSQTLISIFSIPWAILMISLGVWAIFRLTRRLDFSIASYVDWGMVYLSVGGVFFYLARSGITILNVTEPITSLTVIHFHYATLLTPIVFTLSPKPGRTLRTCLVLLLVGNPVLAVGFVGSQTLEFVGVLLIALSLWTFVGHLIQSRRNLSHAVSRVLSVVVILSLASSTLWAVYYAYGQWAQTPTVDIALMVFIHGCVNGIGFVLSGLVALLVERRGTEPLTPLNYALFVKPQTSTDWQKRPIANGNDQNRRTDIYEKALGPSDRFETAMSLVTDYNIFPTHHVRGSAPLPLKLGTTIVQQIRLGPLVLECGVRVTKMELSNHAHGKRFEMIVETLEGHVEAGVESFIVEQDTQADTTTFKIEAKSTPRYWIAKLAAPMAKHTQTKVSREAIARVADLCKQ